MAKIYKILGIAHFIIVPLLMAHSSACSQKEKDYLKV